MPSRSNCAASTNWHSSLKSESVSPGKPAIIDVLIVTPGIVRRIRSSSFRKMSPLEPRFIRFNTRAEACCSGMSMYFTSPG